MSDLRKAAEMALEALEWNYGTDLCDIENCTAWLDKMNATIPALRQALEEPDQDREWVVLTDQEIWECYNHADFKDQCRAVEAKLKEKNT